MTESILILRSQLLNKKINYKIRSLCRFREQADAEVVLHGGHKKPDFRSLLLFGLLVLPIRLVQVQHIKQQNNKERKANNEMLIQQVRSGVLWLYRRECVPR